MTKKIAINGFGRIGRLVLRAIFENCHEQENIEIVAINGPAAIDIHAHLFEFDSSHGKFSGQVSHIDNYLIIENHKKRAKIQITSEKDPSKLPWKKLGVTHVFECTGKFNNKSASMAHIHAGAEKVLVSAPCKEADSTIIMGVNEQDLNNSDQIISVGSCTTNALAPIAKIIDESFEIKHGFMTTIHAYTGDQNILDASHKDLRRARSAAISMIPTSTGAAKSIGIVLPNLAGKLDGSAIRVPTNNVSMIDLTFTTEKELTIESINEAIKFASNNNMKNIISYCDKPLVSIDFNHNSHSAIFDSLETKVLGHNFARVVAWYDNEWGFACRMVDLLSRM